MRQYGFSSRSSRYTHPDMRLALWFMDEARVGQKGCTGRCWWIRGKRLPGLCDKRFVSAYIFAAVRPATGQDFALVLPRVCTEAMNRFLCDFSATVPDDTQAVLVLDGAGWHDPRSVTVAGNLTLVALPPYSPELNPVERVWLYLRERFLSHRLFHDYPPLSTPAAELGTPSRPNPTASDPSAPIPTWIASHYESGGIRRSKPRSAWLRNSDYRKR